MSSGSSPSTEFRYAVNFDPVPGSNAFIVRSVFDDGSYKISDTADSASDNTAQLGDIANEHFSVAGPNGLTNDPSMTYYGKTTNNPGVVGVQPSKNNTNTYFLYTNSKYKSGSYIAGNQISQTPYALCFVSGVRILTTKGEIAVEDLRAGDIAVTASGVRRPIKWVGHRHVGVRGEFVPHDLQPVRILSGAFGRDASGRPVPSRDLRLSPGHPVLVGADAEARGGVLVPVMCLIDGTSIARERVETLTYWHVELDTHDILLAEGLPAESFLDFGCRAFFAEDSDHALHDPDFVPPGLSGRCRPVATEGPLVEAERRRIGRNFAAVLTAQCAWVPETFVAA